MRSRATASYLAFAAFGLFWGTWGASLPGLKLHAGVSDGQLGTALLFVGAGALPAMLIAGRAVDRWGPRLAGVLLIALGVSGALLALLARDLVSLVASMLLVGASSGAADVAINSLAGLAEQASGRRVITRSHGTFSAFVVIGSLAAGGLQVLGAPIALVFGVAGALIAAAGAVLRAVGGAAPAAAPEPALATARRAIPVMLPLVLTGLVGALAFAVENAHQSWGAIFLREELGAVPGLAALAPATFAAFAAATRLAAGYSERLPRVALLLAGGALAAIGTVLVAFSGTVPLALGGLAIAAIGTSVLFPTLLSLAAGGIEPGRRGRATASVSTTAYLGFLLGPAYVGYLAELLGLRGAMLGVAALALIFVVVAAPVTRYARTRIASDR